MKSLKILLFGLFLSFVALHADLINVPVSVGNDDADQEIRTTWFGPQNSMNINATTLNLGFTPAGSGFETADRQHQIGLRFLPMIPAGSSINNATIQFTSASIHTNPTTLSIDGELNSNSPTFTTNQTDISSRTLTGSPVSWSVNPWGQNERGPDEVTSNLTTLVQTLVNQAGWQAGNGMVFVFKPGAGCVDTQCYREAVSFDGDSTNTAVLSVDYTPPPPIPPIMNSIPDFSFKINTSVNIDLANYVTLTNGDPILSYTLTGTLPNGVVFDLTTGIINGAATEIGKFVLFASATDTDGESNIVKFSIFITDNEPIVDYRMDECYWFDNANGVTGDVKDNSLFQNNATTFNSAAVITGVLNNAGKFTVDGDLVETVDPTVGDTAGSLSIAFWAKLDQQLGVYAVVLTKSKAYNWNDGWGFVNPTNSASDTLRFYINNFGGTKIDTVLTATEGWAHFVGTYDGSNLRLYKNSIEVPGSPVANSSGITNSADPLRIAYDDSGDATLKGSIDEVKVWNRALSAAEVTTIYNNEVSGKNYNGATRSSVTCEANIGTNSWELIGIPAESRAPTTIGVQDVFGNDFIGANYNAGANGGWILYKRNYDPVTNDANYSKVDYVNNEAIAFGEAYWLGSTVDTNWSTNNLTLVDYDGLNCASFTNKRCVEIPLHVVSSNGTDGSGPYRYNMTGFVGKKPVEWATCRFDINGTIYSPTAAHNVGLINKTVWQYAGGPGQVKSTDYTTCDDTTPGGCLLLPYHGFWVELNSTTLGATVKLLIPEE